jgi:hypothetical protein
MNTLDILKEIVKITTSTGNGLSMSSLKDSTFVIKMYPIKVFIIEIVILPRKKIKPPIPFVIVNVARFFKARTKAAIAEVQKLSPVRAI